LAITATTTGTARVPIAVIAANTVARSFIVSPIERSVEGKVLGKGTIVGMATVWVTGSADGIGRAAARAMVAAGHQVVLHARNPERAEQALQAVPGADGVLVGDLSSIAQTRQLAGRVGQFDAIVHNAAYLGRGAGPRPVTEDGLELTFAVNVLAPYLLTALAPRPKRLVYFTSQLHTGGTTDLADLDWRRRPYDGGQAYNDSKLYVVALAFAVARRWPEVRSNAVDPGWVRTRMGGPHAAVSVEAGAATAVRLATSDVTETGHYLSERGGGVHPAAERVDFQEAVLNACAAITGTELKAS
jgi:NAD(P)-dependent dehydrogenase (short-subunit alcohol dehydrogenase family)